MEVGVVLCCSSVSVKEKKIGEKKGIDLNFYLLISKLKIG